MAILTRYAALDRDNKLYYLIHHHGWFTKNHWTIGMDDRTKTIVAVGESDPRKDIKLIHENTIKGFQLFIAKDGKPHKVTGQIVFLWKIHKGCYHKVIL
jgi:hypothetical protein